MEIRIKMSLGNKHEPVIAKFLEVKVRGDFDQASKIFKNLVQKEGVLALYKEKQSYEKPSIKRRRKKLEAIENRKAAEMKQQLIESGEWERRMKKKLKRKEQKMRQKSQQGPNSNE
jgi:small subunit ribosomal protein S21